jgi:DNA-binding transcriptional regulator YhcF (GntR family)
MILGIDVSTYLEELEHGAKYFDGNVQIDPLDAFRQNGVDHMRIRIWNDPYSPEGEPYLAGSCGIENYIRLGVLRDGDKLPSVRTAAAELGVNPNTVQRALSELENTGLVHANRTSGRFITEDESLVAEVKSHIALKETTEFVAKMNQLGLGKNEIVKLINGSEDNDNEKNN